MSKDVWDGSSTYGKYLLSLVSLHNTQHSTFQSTKNCSSVIVACKSLWKGMVWALLGTLTFHIRSMNSICRISQVIHNCFSHLLPLLLADGVISAKHIHKLQWKPMKFVIMRLEKAPLPKGQAGLSVQAFHLLSQLVRLVVGLCPPLSSL